MTKSFGTIVSIERQTINTFKLVKLVGKRKFILEERIALLDLFSWFILFICSAKGLPLVKVYFLLFFEFVGLLKFEKVHFGQPARIIIKFLEKFVFIYLESGVKQKFPPSVSVNGHVLWNRWRLRFLKRNVCVQLGRFYWGCRLLFWLLTVGCGR